MITNLREWLRRTFDRRFSAEKVKETYAYRSIPLDKVVSIEISDDASKHGLTEERAREILRRIPVRVRGLINNQIGMPNKPEEMPLQITDYEFGRRKESMTIVAYPETNWCASQRIETVPYRSGGFILDKDCTHYHTKNLWAYLIVSNKKEFDKKKNEQ